MLSVYSGMGLDLSQATVARQQQRQQQNLTQYHEFVNGGCFSLAPYDASSYYGNLAMPTSAGATNGVDWYMTRLSSTAPTSTVDMVTPTATSTTALMSATTTTTAAAAAAAAAAAVAASADIATIAPATPSNVTHMGYVDRSASYYPSPVINTPPPTTLSGLPVDSCVYTQPMAPSPSAVTMTPPIVMPPSPTFHQHHHHPGYPGYIYPGSVMDDGCNSSLNCRELRSSYHYSSPLLMHYHRHHPYNGSTRRSSMHTSRSSSPSTLSSAGTLSASSSTSTSTSSSGMSLSTSTSTTSSSTTTTSSSTSSSSSSVSSSRNSPGVYYHPQRPLMATFNTKATSSTPKRYKCNICGKKFTRPSSLNTHTYSHTGEKPFKCPVEGCGRHFSVVSNLRRHAKIHNNASATLSTATTTSGVPSSS